MLYISDYIFSCYAFLFIFDFPNPLSKHILQFHTSFLGESVTTKRKKSIDLAAQSGAANEVVSRYGSASKEHLVSYSGVDSQYINGIKIWNK